ncbi:MAG: prolipoprotein diacylglyceryl transferase [Ruminococcus sp.]|nr:prolipoprotein diacylglyceryl transferase [Ruminococcus sp.]
MCPYVDLWGLELPVYGLISVVGILVSATVAFVLAKKKAVDLYDFLITAVVGGLGLFIGAHLLYALTRTGDIISAFSLYNTFDTTGEFIKYLLDIASGMVFYGGLYGGLLAGFLWIRHKKHPAGLFADIFAVVIPLFHSFGRVGCFFAGCCYGVKWEYGISGRVLNSGVRELTARFPVQLVEAACLLVLFSLLLVFFLRGKAQGRLLTVYLASYAVLRFVLEFFRGDSIRGHLLYLSTSQWISLLTLIGVGLYLFLSRRKYAKE